MTLKKNKNFLNLIFGRVITNFGDSLYSITIVFITISVYNLGASSLALFGLAAYLPSMLNFLFGSYIDNFKNKKMLMIYLEVIQLICIICVLVTLLNHSNFYLLLLFHFIFSLANSLIYPVQSSIVPQILKHNYADIQSSVYAMNITNNFTDILSNFVASGLLVYMSVTGALSLDIATFIIAIFFFSKISLKGKNTDEKVEDDTNKPDNEEKQGIIFSFRYFFSKKIPSQIVVLEGILSGFTTMVMRIIGVYLVVINVDVEYIGILLGVQRGAEVVGVLISNKIKMSFRNFFVLDYLVSGACIISIYYFDNIALKLLLFFIAFMLIGMSGTVYGKMIYHYYDHKHMGKVSSVINSTSSVAIVACMIIPLIYDDVSNLILMTGIITVIFGVYLLMFKNDHHEKKMS